MPALIIILGLAGLVIVIGGYALQELGRPYPEEHDAKRKSKTEAERLQRHAERDAILAHAEIVDQRTKAEIKRQYMREQYPPGTPIPDVPMPELPPDPREAMADAVPNPNLRHRKPLPEEEPDERPSVPDARDLRGALARLTGGNADEGQGGGQGRAADRSAALRDALSRGKEPGPDAAEDGPRDDRAGLLKSRLAGLRAQAPGEETPGPTGGPDEIPDAPDVSEAAAKRGPFGRKARTPAEPEGAPAPKPRHGLFGKKPKPGPDVPTDGPDGAGGPEDANEPPAKPRRGLFGRRTKHGREPEPEPTGKAVRPTDDAPPARTLADYETELEPDEAIPDVPDGDAEDMPEPSWPGPALGSGDAGGDIPEIVPDGPAQESPWPEPSMPGREPDGPGTAEEDIPALPEDEDPDADLEPEDGLTPVEDEE